MYLKNVLLHNIVSGNKMSNQSISNDIYIIYIYTVRSIHIWTQAQFCITLAAVTCGQVW